MRAVFPTVRAALGDPPPERKSFANGFNRYENKLRTFAAGVKRRSPKTRPNAEA
jgi:hypothetical protein